MERRLGARPILMQLPFGEEGAFTGVVDLLGEQLLTFADSDRGSTVEYAPVPEDWSMWQRRPANCCSRRLPIG